MFNVYVGRHPITNNIYQRLRPLTYATLTQVYYCNQAVPIKEISERLGHADTSITDRIYAHVMPEEKEKTAAKFANFVGF